LIVSLTALDSNNLQEDLKLTVKPLKSDEKMRTTVNQKNGPKEKERADKRVEQAEC